MTNIILLCYGRKIEYRRAIISILSFKAWYSKNTEVRFIVFTDNPSYFIPYLAGIEAEYKPLSEELLNEMLAGSDYIHRRKVCVIREVLKRYPSDDLLFLDSDTFLTGDPSALTGEMERGKYLMHTREYRLAEAPEIYRKYMSTKLKDAEKYPRAFLRLIKERSFVINNVPVEFNESQYCWNSGVLGLPAASAALIDDILKICDDFYAGSSWFISEQLAFSLVLNNRGDIYPAEHVINHYYQFKEGMDALSSQFFTDGFRRLSLIGKQRIIRRFTRSAGKLTKLDFSLMISLNSFRRGLLKKGFLFSVKALANIPLNKDFLTYIQLKMKNQL